MAITVHDHSYRNNLNLGLFMVLKHRQWIAVETEASNSDYRRLYPATLGFVREGVCVWLPSAPQQMYAPRLWILDRGSSVSLKPYSLEDASGGSGLRTTFNRLATCEFVHPDIVETYWF